MSAEPQILAVDDDAGILHLARLELASQGFRVIVARDGLEACTSLTSTYPIL